MEMLVTLSPDVLERLERLATAEGVEPEQYLQDRIEMALGPFRPGLRLAECLAERRRALGLTQSDVAVRCASARPVVAGLQHVTISQFEKGYRRPSLTQLRALAKALEFTEGETAVALEMLHEEGR